MKKRKRIISMQKIISSIMLVVVLSVTIPKPVHAEDDGFGGKLLKPLVQLVASLGDVAIGLLNHYMLGTENLIDSVMLDKEDPNVTEGSLQVTGKEATTKEVDEPLTGFMFGDWKLPNMLYSPENIFANKIAALDVNFINPHTYNSAQTDTENNVSVASDLQNVVATWYKTFRNIAIVGLLSVLIYLGIRILIESTAQGKAKYKERLIDWLVALCLVFAMQYIMSATLMITEKITQLFDTSGSTRVVVQLTGENEDEKLGSNGQQEFSTNLMGYMRFMAQRDNFGDATAYTIIYLALVIFTIKFTFTYLKRVLYMAFFTMVSPLVALTYPIDKVADGKAQAFNLWFKEYMMNAIIQPVHLILYTALISAAADLAINNPIYALVAIYFLVPAEKFIKKMFRFDRGQTPGGLGDFAAGAVTMSALKSLTSKGSSSGKSSGGSNSSSEDNGKIRTRSDIKNLSEWTKGGTEENGNNGDDVQPNPIIRTGRDQQPVEEEQGRELTPEEQAAIDRYSSEGYGVNTNGEYFNPWTSEYDPYYNPVNDGAYNNMAQQDANNSGEDANARENLQINPDVRSRLATSNPTFRQRLGAAGRTLRRGTVGAATTAVSNTGRRLWNNKGKIAKSGIRFAGKTAGGIAGGIAGGVALGTIGMAAGLTTGDPSKVAQYTAGAAGGGYALGRRPGSSLGNASAQWITERPEAIHDAYSEELYGNEGARQRKLEKELKKEKRNFLLDKENQAKWANARARLEAKTGNKYSMDQVLSAVYDYQAAGIKDDKMIEKGLQIEAKHDRGGNIGEGNSNHGKYINIAQEVGKFSNDILVDTEKRQELENRFNRKLGNQKGQEAMEIFAEFHSENELYRQGTQRRRGSQPAQRAPRAARAQQNGAGTQPPEPDRAPRPRRGTT